MPRSTEALVEPDILRWARATAGLSVEEAASSLQTRPEKLQAVVVVGIAHVRRRNDAQQREWFQGRLSCAILPPSTVQTCSVTKLASSERSQATNAATSSGRPVRPTGWIRPRSRRRWEPGP